MAEETVFQQSVRAHCRRRIQNPAKRRRRTHCMHERNSRRRACCRHALTADVASNAHRVYIHTHIQSDR